MKKTVKSIERPEFIVFERINRQTEVEEQALKLLIKINSLNEDKKINNNIIFAGVILASAGTIITMKINPEGLSLIILGVVATIYALNKNRKIKVKLDELRKKFNMSIKELINLNSIDIENIDLIELEDDDIEIVPERVRKI